MASEKVKSWRVYRSPKRKESTLVSSNGEPSHRPCPRPPPVPGGWAPPPGTPHLQLPASHRPSPGAASNLEAQSLLPCPTRLTQAAANPGSFPSTSFPTFSHAESFNNSEQLVVASLFMGSLLLYVVFISLGNYSNKLINRHFLTFGNPS